MRNKLLLVVSAFALATGPATAQTWIGGVVGNMMGQRCGKWCYDGTAKLNAKYLAGQIPYVDQGMDKYVGLDRTTSSLDKMFTGTREHRVMFNDETQVDTRTVSKADIRPQERADFDKCATAHVGRIASGSIHC